MKRRILLAAGMTVVVVSGTVVGQLPSAHLRDAKLRYERTAEAARSYYTGLLQKARQAAIQGGKHHEAETLGAEIRRVSAQAEGAKVPYRDYLPVPQDDWTVRYTNGYTRHYVFRPDGTVELGELVSGIEQGPEFFLLEFDDGKLERWIPMANGTFHVDHYNPKTTYPDKPPDCIGVAREYPPDDQP